MTERDPRTAAEWIAFGCSCLVLAALIGLIVLQLGDDRAPAAPVAEVVGEARAVDDLHHVDVTVANHGDETAANVQVSATLVVEGEETSADQTIDFLAGDAEEDLVFVFEDDPDEGDLTIEVTSFADP